MVKSILYLLLLLLLPFLGFGQDNPLAQQEAELQVLLDSLRKARKDSVLKRINKAYKQKLEETLEMDGVFDYPFSKLQTMGSIKSPDDAFRLFNWNIEQEDGSYSYYCYVLKEKGKRNRVIELRNMSANLPERQLEEMALDNNRWFGALYYKIIPVEKGSRTYYTLLGWDGHDQYSNKKIIEVMSLSGSRRIKFGAPIFETGEGRKRRVILEYMEGVAATIKYERKKRTDYLVFDHLSPKAPQLVGMYEHYVPDGSYDAFKWEEGKWILQLDYYAVNPKTKDDRPFNDPRKDDHPNKR